MRDIYPYFVFLWLNVIDLKCIKYMQKKQGMQLTYRDVQKTQLFSGLPPSLNTTKFRKSGAFKFQHVQFPASKTKRYWNSILITFSLVVLPPKKAVPNQAATKESLPYAVQHFYYHKQQLIQSNLQLSSLHLLERLYIMIMLFNSDISSGIFSLFYLALAFFMWSNITKSHIRTMFNK